MEEERPSCCKEEYGKARSVIGGVLALPRTFLFTKIYKRIYKLFSKAFKDLSWSVKQEKKNFKRELK